MNLSLDWLRAIQLKPRFLFGIWILGMLVLFLPENLATSFGIVKAKIDLHPWLGLGTLAAFSFWLVQLIPAFQSFRSRRRYRMEMIRSLKSISPEEWILLAYCIERKQQRITLTIVNRVAGSLVSRGILKRAEGGGNIVAWPYTIPNFLWEHLLANREMFLGNAPFPEAEVVARLQNLHHQIHRHDF
jgi:hypothetical protein